MLVVPCAHISTEVKVFSLAESQAELMLKMCSMGTYHANFVIESGDVFRVSGARVRGGDGKFLPKKSHASIRNRW